MYCLSIRADIDAPVTPALPSPAKLRGPMTVPGLAHAGLLDVVVDEAIGETVGITGTEELGAIAPAMGNALGSGTAGVELTPRLPISKEANGIPVRAAPPSVVGEVDVGADDAARLLEPEPHIPDIPDVSSIPEDAEDVDIAVVPEDDAVAGAAVPTAIPPPSKLAVDPNISEGGVAVVEHAVPLLVVGIVIVPVTPVGNGLSPGDVISVAPNGIPAGELVEPVVMPSGEVVPIIGVGVTVPSNGSSTCAIARLPTRSAGSTVAISRNFAGILGFPAESPRRAPTLIIATGSLAVRLSDIGQSLGSGVRSFGNISSGRCSISCPALHPVSVAPRRTPKAFLARPHSLENADGNLWLAAARERPALRQAPRSLIQRVAGLERPG
jgi:hypothetical protein